MASPITARLPPVEACGEIIDIPSTSPDNNFPTKPTKPSGPTSGNIKINYNFSTSSTDSDNDKIRYKFDWGDDSYTDWFGPYISGTDASESHTWSVGVYDIRVKAKDTRGVETNWSDPFRITMPRNRANSLIIFNIMWRFLDTFPIFRYLLVKKLRVKK